MRKDMVLGHFRSAPLRPEDCKGWGIHSGTISTEFGLSDLSPGNQPARWSVTGSINSGRRDVAGGCLHDEILKYWPDLAPLVALHLSDESGAPMHAEANGWYQLAGYWGGLGEQYHTGNSKRNFPATPPADKPWQNYEHRLPTREECLASFAEHCRMSIDEARALADRLVPPDSPLLRVGEYLPAEEYKAQRGTVRQLWAVECGKMRPRWQAESDAGKALMASWGAKDSRVAVA